MKPCRFVLLLALAAPLRAEVRLASPFTHHMVLQRELPVPVWGWADPAEKVTVAFAGQKQTATARADGKWMLRLTPLTASDASRDFVLTGKNTLALQDVLVGEVWLGSGPSNMDFAESDARICHCDGRREAPIHRTFHDAPHPPRLHALR